MNTICRFFWVNNNCSFKAQDGLRNHVSRISGLALWKSCLVGGLLVLGSPSPALAQEWNAVTGDWNTPGNWTPSGPPNASSPALINNGGEATLSGSSGASSSLSLGSSLGSTGNTLILENGAVLSTGSVQVGQATGSSGVITLQGADTTLNSSINTSNISVLGFNGSALLEVLDGATWNIATASVISLYMSENGIDSSTLRVSGANSLVAVTSSFTDDPEILMSGESAIEVLNGGRITAGVIGTGAYDRPIQITVDGANSEIQLSRLLSLRNDLGPASAEVTISNGGRLEAPTVQTRGSNQEILVTGSGSALAVDNLSLSWGQSSNDSTLTISNLASVNVQAFADFGSVGTALVAINTGGLLVTESQVTLGLQEDAVGTVTLNDSQWNANGTVRVGAFGEGNLSLANGAILNSQSAVDIGQSVGSVGEVLVEGSSSWTAAAPISVGTAGEGFLGVRTASSLSSTGIVVGELGTGEGTMEVSGLGTIVGNTGSFEIGRAGSGTLNVLHGGEVDSGNGALTIGGSTAPASGNGTLNVSGDGSQLTAGGIMEVGLRGTGELNIDDGGTVSVTARTRVGVEAGSSGSINVEGLGSELTLSKSWLTDIGSSGLGSLAIGSAGTVTSGAMTLGSLASGDGFVVVTGVNSKLDLGNSEFRAGDAGDGTVEIYDGGLISSGRVFIGRQNGSTSSATISGEGSLWASTAQLTLGNFNGSTGTLEILEGGTMTADGTTIVGNAGNGRMVVDGEGSEFSTLNTLALAAFTTGVGELEITNGGTVSSVGAIFASNSGGQATALIDGEGSAWDVTGGSSFNIGQGGQAKLEVLNGGRFSAVGSFRVGNAATSVGTVTISGGDSTASSNGEVTVGESGQGMFLVLDGAYMQSNALTVGAFSGSLGQVDIDGAGSFWESSTYTRVGVFGSGALDVRNDGYLSTDSMMVGEGSTGDGVVDLSGAGSTIFVASGLTVGNLGTGEVTVDLGAELNTSFAVIGAGANGIGEVLIQGIGTDWIVNSSITLGSGHASAAGQLQVFDGATLDTVQIQRGIGAGKVEIRDSRIRFSGSQAALFDGFQPGDVELIAGAPNGAAIFDTRQHQVASAANIGGSGGLEKVGSGKLIFSGTNTYEGQTTITQGTFMIDDSGSINETAGITIDGAELQYSSSVDYEGGAVDFVSGTLSGTNWQGNLTDLTIGPSQRISPGNSVGEAIGESQTWTSGGTLLWEINNATGLAGGPSGWDLISFNDTLNINATTLTPFVIEVTSLQLDNAQGLATNFDPVSNYQWLIAQTQEEIAAFDGVFFVNHANFSNASNGVWSVIRGDVIGEGTNELYLTYVAVPEPTTGALLLAGLGVLLAHRRSHRNQT